MSTKGIILKWGLIGGAITTIFGLLSYMLGFTESKIMQYFGVILLLAIIVFGLFEYRDKLNGGFANFRDLLKVGLMIGLIMALISSIWIFIHMGFLDTEMVARMLLKVEVEFESQGLSNSEIQNKLEIAKKSLSPFYLFIKGLTSNLFVSGIISLISAFVIKNEKPSASLGTD